VLLGGDVCHERDDFAGYILAVGFGDGLKLLFRTTNYVDLGAVDSKSLDAHETNTRACSMSTTQWGCVSMLISLPPPVTRATLPFTSKRLPSCRSALLVSILLVDVEYVKFGIGSGYIGIEQLHSGQSPWTVPLATFAIFAG